MKAKNKFLALAATAVLTLSACGSAAPTSSPAASTAPESATPATTAPSAPAESTQPGTGSASGKTLCYVTAAASHPYVTPFNQALQAVADGAGVEVITLSQEFDAQKGADQLNTCIGRAPDAIMLWPLDPKAYIPAMQKAQAANIPLIIVNSPMDPSADPYFVTFTGPDNVEEGKQNADMMNKALNGQGDIVIVAGQAGNGVTLQRTSGFTDQLAALGSKLNVLATVNADFDQQKALVAMRDLITRFGDKIVGVYAEDDIMAAGVLDAYKETGATKLPVVTGIGGARSAFDRITDGTMYGTIYQSPFEDGKLAMETMVAILSGQTVEKRIPLHLEQITKDNVGQFQPAF